MAVLLDSAEPADAAVAAELGFVRGVTTNPKLLNGAEPIGRLREILSAIPDVPVFYQLTSIETPAGAINEAQNALALDPGRIVIKIPTRTPLLAVAEKLVSQEQRCAMTAIFSTAQALVAAEIGVAWVIPYVDRTSRLGGDGPALVTNMRKIIAATGGTTRVMAGSIKSPDGAADAVACGAHDVTASLEVISGMGQHEWSERSIAEFAEAGS